MSDARDDKWHSLPGTIQREAESMLHTCEHVTGLTEGQHIYDTAFVLRLCRAVFTPSHALRNCTECGGLGHSSEVPGMKCPHCGGSGKETTPSTTPQIRWLTAAEVSEAGHYIREGSEKLSVVEWCEQPDYGPGVLRGPRSMQVGTMRYLICDGSSARDEDWGDARFYGPISLQALVKDRESIGAMAGLLAKARAERDTALSATPRSGWIPVDERLPKDWEPVLVHVPEKRPGIRDEGQTVAIAHRYGEDKDYGPAGWTVSSIVWGDPKGEITHWMPLPKGPNNSPDGGKA